MSRTLPKVSKDVYKNIIDLAGPNCEEVTNKYRNCRPPFIYKRGNVKASCCAECMKHLDQWLLQLLEHLPKYLYNRKNGTMYKRNHVHNLVRVFGESKDYDYMAKMNFLLPQDYPSKHDKNVRDAISEVQRLLDARPRTINILLPYELIEDGPRLSEIVLNHGWENFMDRLDMDDVYVALNLPQC